MNSGPHRATIYTPAVTIVAAWINALTGVGPSIASGSQTYSGIWALLPTAPVNSSRQIVVIHTWICVILAAAAARSGRCRSVWIACGSLVKAACVAAKTPW